MVDIAACHTLQTTGSMQPGHTALSLLLFCSADLLFHDISAHDSIILHIKEGSSQASFTVPPFASTGSNSISH